MKTMLRISSHIECRSLNELLKVLQGHTDRITELFWGRKNLLLSTLDLSVCLSLHAYFEILTIFAFRPWLSKFAAKCTPYFSNDALQRWSAARFQNSCLSKDRQTDWLTRRSKTPLNCKQTTGRLTKTFDRQGKPAVSIY